MREAWPAKGLTTDYSNPVHPVHPCFFLRISAFSALLACFARGPHGSCIPKIKGRPFWPFLLWLFTLTLLSLCSSRSLRDPLSHPTFFDHHYSWFIFLPIPHSSFLIPNSRALARLSVLCGFLYCPHFPQNRDPDPV